jgi:hypothetical protein
LVNPYEVLGVTPEAEQEAIHGAFRGLARKYHPDANPDDRARHERMKLINEAYHVLGNPGRRAAYDQQHRPARGSAHHAHPVRSSTHPHRPVAREAPKVKALTSRQFTKRVLVGTGTALTTFLVAGSVAGVTHAAWPLTVWLLGWSLAGAVALLAGAGPPSARRSTAHVLGCAGLLVSSFCAARLIADASEPAYSGVPLLLWLALWMLVGGVALIARAGGPSRGGTMPRSGPARPVSPVFIRRSAANSWGNPACSGSRGRRRPRA